MLTETQSRPEFLALQSLLVGAYPPERFKIGIPQIASYAADEQQVIRKSSSANLAEQYVVDVTNDQGATENLSFFAKTMKAKNPDVSYRAVATEVKAVELFIKHGKGFATYEVLGVSAGLEDKHMRRDANPVLITKTIPGLSGLDGEIQFEQAIEDQNPWEFTSSTVGILDRPALEGVLGLLYFMHSNGLYHKDSQPKNFGRVTADAISGNDEFNGIKVIDFEQSRFREPAPNSKEKQLTQDEEVANALEDILTFYTYINLADSLGGEDQRINFLDQIQTTYANFIQNKGGDIQAFRNRLDQMLYT